MFNTLSAKRGHMLILEDTTQFPRNDAYILKHLVEGWDGFAMLIGGEKEGNAYRRKR